MASQNAEAPAAARSNHKKKRASARWTAAERLLNLYGEPLEEAVRSN